MSIQILGDVAPTALSQTRVELHWLTQVVGAIGDAFLDRAPDDSQSNAVWDDPQSALIGRPIGDGTRLGIRFEGPELVVLKADGSVSSRAMARGKTLSDLLFWAGNAIGAASSVAPKKPPLNRDYDMPGHPVSEGAPFTLADDSALTEFARWFGNVTAWLGEARGIDARASEVECWPHHFDIGGVIMLEPDKPFEEARQMGFGWSPGDSSYDQPYLYITPSPAPDDLPALASGKWHSEGFTGAVLTAAEVASSAAQNELVQTFLKTTIERTLPLITP